MREPVVFGRNRILSKQRSTTRIRLVVAGLVLLALLIAGTIVTEPEVGGSAAKARHTGCVTSGGIRLTPPSPRQPPEANDFDVDGDTLIASLVTGPASGSLTLNVDGTFEYTPNLDRLHGGGLHNRP